MRISVCVTTNVLYNMAITATTPVLTANDWMYAKDIRPGDYVFNRLGQPVKVKLTQTFRSEECYRVTFDDYLSVDGDNALILPVEDVFYRNKCHTYKGRFKKTSPLKQRTLPQLLDHGIFHRGTRRWFSVPTTEPIQLPTQPLDIPPFVYGFWFFSRLPDKKLQVKEELKDFVFQKFRDAGYKTRAGRKNQRGYINFTTEPPIWRQLAGQDTHKVPATYLNGSPEQRFELLQGILHAKLASYKVKQDHFEYVSGKKSTITTIQYLAESIGAATRIHYDKYLNNFRLKIITKTRIFENQPATKPVVHLARRYIAAIDKIPAQLCVHIETDDSDGSYLVGEGFISCI